MPEVKLLQDPAPAGVDIVGWAVRIGLALAFVSFGLDKFPSGTPWVSLFDRIGIGQWFRYATGIVEMSGGVLLIVPRTAILGAAMLSCTMLGAMLVHVAVTGHPANALIPALFLAALVAIGIRVWSRA